MMTQPRIGTRRVLSAQLQPAPMRRQLFFFPRNLGLVRSQAVHCDRVMFGNRIHIRDVVSLASTLPLSERADWNNRSPIPGRPSAAIHRRLQANTLYRPARLIFSDGHYAPSKNRSTPRIRQHHPGVRTKLCPRPLEIDAQAQPHLNPTELLQTPSPAHANKYLLLASKICDATPINRKQYTAKKVFHNQRA